MTPSRPFDPARREAFLARVREGASVRSACRLTGVSTSVVRDWRKGTRPEHVAFQRAYDEAVAECTHAAVKRLEAHAAAELGGSGSVKATLALLAARDPRFGDMDLRRRKLAAEIELAKLQAEASRMKNEVLRRATEGAEQGGRFLLGHDLVNEASLSEATRAELAAYYAREKVTALPLWALGADEGLT